MFQIVWDPSSVSFERACLKLLVIFFVLLFGVWQRNFEPGVCVHGATSWISLRNLKLVILYEIYSYSFVQVLSRKPLLLSNCLLVNLSLKGVNIDAILKPFQLHILCSVFCAWSTGNVAEKCPETKWRFQLNNSITTKNGAAYCYKKSNYLNTRS